MDYIYIFKILTNIQYHFTKQLLYIFLLVQLLSIYFKYLNYYLLSLKVKNCNNFKPSLCQIYIKHKQYTILKDLNFQFDLNQQFQKLYLHNNIINYHFPGYSNIQYLMHNINQDNTSDLKLCERFHYESGNYFLNMFNKKTDSILVKKAANINLQEKNKSVLKNPSIPITPLNNHMTPIQDPSLKNDLTKPIWKCLSQVDPRIVCVEISEKCPESVSPIPSINKMLSKFAEKYKNEHEDESNLVILLKRVKLQNEKEKTLQNLKLYEQNKQNLSPQLKQLQFVYSVLLKLNRFFKSQQNFEEVKHKQTENRKSCFPQYLQFCSQIVSYYLREECIKSYFKIFTMNKIICQNLNDVLDFNIGSLAICLEQTDNFLSLIIHPVILSVYNCLSMQLKSQINAQANNEMYDKKGIIFPDFPLGNSSKVVFINLDGYQSQANIQLAKQMYKNFMYFSFPKQSSLRCEEFQRFLSERLLKKYHYKDRDVKERNNYYSYFEKKQKDVKKNVFVFPIRSLALEEELDLPDIQHYQSTYIRFILEEIAYSQILEFNPSLIIVSYSNKICMLNQDFQEIIRNITILGNYRVGLYANFSRTGIFESSELVNLKKSLSVTSAKIIDRLTQNYIMNDIHNSMMQKHVSIDFLDKLSRFLKISSGTYNLNKPDEKDDKIAKYKNSKITKYAGMLIKYLGKQNVNIEKFSMRANNYISISRLLEKTLSFSSCFQLFDKTLTKFHKNLLGSVQELLKKHKQVPQTNVQYKRVLNKIITRFSNKHIQSKLQDLKFQYCMQYANEKLENFLPAYIPKFKCSIYEKQNIQEIKPQIGESSNLIYLSFEIEQEAQFYSVQFSSTTKFYYENVRQNKNALIYAINYLPHKQSKHYQNFYGVITPEFQSKLQGKLKLQPIQFQYSLNEFVTFKEFNYFETDKFVFMFWPQLHDCRLELLSYLAGEKYLPQPTNFIFRALRNQPNAFFLMNVENLEQYKQISPRTGCKCYNLPEYNMFYIFGGFYINQANYLNFQSDITAIKYNQSSVEVKNIPKTFYFDYKIEGQTSVVTNQKNYIVRPRLQYEILENPCEQFYKQQIFLLGGIGQKFLRPYSLIGYMAHKIVFEGPNISQIKRMKMNNIIPINLNQPVKNRSQTEIQTPKIAQNRYIYSQQETIPKDSYQYYHHKVYYNPENQSFNYDTQFNYGIISSKTTRGQLSMINKKSQDIENPQFPIKCYKKKQKPYSPYYLYLKGEKEKIYFQISKKSHIEILKSSESLKPPDIQSIDNICDTLYAIIKILYTHGDKHMLVSGNMNLGKSQSQPSEKIQLKPIYIFDQDISGNILISIDKNTIAILHGFNFSQGKQNNPYEIVLRYSKNGASLISYKVRSNYNRYLTLQSSMKNSNPLKQSLFIRLLNKTILCFTFRSLKREFNCEKVAIIMEQLDFNGNQYAWKNCKEIESQFIFNGIAQLQKSGLPLKVQRICPKNLKEISCFFDIEIIYNEQKYHGTINLSENSLVKLNIIENIDNSQQIIMVQDKICIEKEPMIK